MQLFLGTIVPPARASRYEVEFTNFAPDVNIRLGFGCENVQLPGKSAASITNRIYGPKKEIAYELLYTNVLPMTFRLSQDLIERMVFERWMNEIVGDKRFDLGYEDDYVAEMKLRLLDLNDDRVGEYTFTRVYPKSLGEQFLSFDAKDRYMVQPVTLAFQEYRMTGFLDPGTNPV